MGFHGDEANYSRHALRRRARADDVSRINKAGTDKCLPSRSIRASKELAREVALHHAHAAGLFPGVALRSVRGDARISRLATASERKLYRFVFLVDRHRTCVAAARAARDQVDWQARLEADAGSLVYVHCIRCNRVTDRRGSAACDRPRYSLAVLEQLFLPGAHYGSARRGFGSRFSLLRKPDLATAGGAGPIKTMGTGKGTGGEGCSRSQTVVVGI